VPFVVAGPGVKAGAQCDVPVSQWDLLPTLHDYAKSTQPLPKDLDGASLRGVFEKGNASEVKRPVEGFVFHYPCYFAPPLTVIRLGDYKLMEHHLSGEQKLFNVKTDYSEQTNLIESMPEKASELRTVMMRYLDVTDAEDVQDVYKARFAGLDHFEAMARQHHTKSIARAKGDQKLIAEADARLKEQLERFERNRQECRANMHGKTF